MASSCCSADYARCVCREPIKGTIKNAEATSSEDISILWADGFCSKYNIMFLRVECKCNRCVHEASSQKLFTPGKLTDDLKAKSISVAGDGKSLSVVWEPNGHESHYNANWLRANSCDESSLKAMGASYKTSVPRELEDLLDYS